MAASFWWGGSESQRIIHWQSWDKMCRSKANGGLGFRDLSLFNQSLIAKQGWRLIQSPNSLVGRLLRDKYFLGVSFLDVQAKPGVSYLWRSILWGRDALKRGLRLRAGDGSSIRVFLDPWLPRPSTFRVISKHTDITKDWKVADLISPSRDWNWTLIDQHFLPMDKDVIAQIPLGRRQATDRWMWHFEANGKFTVRSCYRNLMATRIQDSTSDGAQDKWWWNLLWRLRIPTKVKVFVWRAFHHIIPCYSQLHSRGIPCQKPCPRCSEEAETVPHALFSCSETMETWHLSCFATLVSNFPKTSVDNLFLHVARRLSVEELEVFCVLCWFIWKDRNSIVHNDKGKQAAQLIDAAGGWLAEFQSRCDEPKANPQVSPSVNWSAPNRGEWKLNVDAAIFGEERQIGVGAVIRNNEGEVLAILSTRRDGQYDPFLAECLAIRSALQALRDANLQVSVVESDSLRAIQAILKPNDLAPESPVINDILELCERGNKVEFVHTPRTGNVVAHTLARVASSNSPANFLFDVIPDCISQLIKADVAH